MKVWEAVTDAKTGETIRRQVEAPDVVTPEAQSVVDQQLAQVAATESANETSLRGQADAALASLRTYRDKATTTTADDKAVLKVLVKVAIALIRLFLRKLDGVN